LTQFAKNLKPDRNSASGHAIDNAKADPTVHPFVQGLANAGAILGRDIGIIALKSMNSSRGEGFHEAVLYWSADRIPSAIKIQIPEAMLAKVHGVMIVPKGATIEGFLFEETTRAASRPMVDGSQLVIFEKAAANEA
jgi:hypothetical protein